MSKKELKLQNKDLEISVVDILSSLDPSKTGKFTPFLIKMLRREMGFRKLKRLCDNEIGGILSASPNVVERQVINHIVELLGYDNVLSLKKFSQHLEENRIPENRRDITQYQNWQDLDKEITIANIKQDQKRLEKEVIKVLENDEWLLIRPLTLESSLTYGSGTKWCTAMKNNSEYFYRYCRNGVLTYVISKKDGDKYGIYFDHHSNDFSIWDAPDRRIDSVESSIPSDIIKTILKMSKMDKPNFDYFSPEEKEKSGGDLKKASFADEVAVPRQEYEYEADLDVELRDPWDPLQGGRLR